MKKVGTAILLITFLAAAGLSQPTKAQDQVRATTAPGNPFYTVESFVEKMEVGLAGVIGGPDLKAKAIANNAEESLAEAEKLAERNQSAKAARMVQRYEQNMNRSKELAEKGQKRNLSERLQNISGNNVQRLEEVKQKVPEEAQKGIQNAIENSKRRVKPADVENRSEKPQTATNVTRGRPDLENRTLEKPTKTEKPGKLQDNATKKPSIKPNKTIDSRTPNKTNKTIKNTTDGLQDNPEEKAEETVEKPSKESQTKEKGSDKTEKPVDSVNTDIY